MKKGFKPYYLAKRKSGIYHLYYDKPNGKITSISTKTRIKSEAMRFMATFQVQQERAALKKEVAPIRLRAIAFQFMRAQAMDHTDNTIATYRTTFNNLIEYLSDIYIEEITQAKMQEYFIHRTRNRSVYPARKDRINLGYAFNWAVN